MEEGWRGRGGVEGEGRGGGVGEGWRGRGGPSQVHCPNLYTE